VKGENGGKMGFLGGIESKWRIFSAIFSEWMTIAGMDGNELMINIPIAVARSDSASDQLYVETCCNTSELFTILMNHIILFASMYTIEHRYSYSRTTRMNPDSNSWG